MKFDSFTVTFFNYLNRSNSTDNQYIFTDSDLESMKNVF